MFFKRIVLYPELREHKSNICQYWREYDGEKGIFEYCKLVKKSCYCCGTIKQCSFKYKRTPIRNFIKNIFHI